MRNRTSRTYGRRVIVKARFVRTAMSSSKALAEHLRYISRDGAMREEDQGQLFNTELEDADRSGFVENAKDDRHHFRLIVSPEDGAEMKDMKPFVRDLVSKMESDLGTRLEWVAAVHDNTDHPHAHIVIRGKRDDGRDLVMPRKYISHGIRARAENLVSLELGPQTQLEKDLKMARQTGAKRLTDIDRALARLSSETGALNLNHTPPRYLALNKARLRALEGLGLAEHIKGGQWQLSKGFEQTLNTLGEERDIIKQMHKALRGKTDRSLDPARAPHIAGADKAIIGTVLKSGLRGEGHDEPYVILDCMDGRVTMTKLDKSIDPSDLKPGMIVSLTRPDTEPKPSDKTIAKIAVANEGVYSTEVHQQADPRSSREFIAAHVRRLEALRRAGLVQRETDGTWHIPHNYLDQVKAHQARLARQNGPKITIESWGNLSSQVEASGLTWLDESPAPRLPARGFGNELRQAHSERGQHLRALGMMKGDSEELTPSERAKLYRAGLDKIGDDLSSEMGKPYSALPNRGHIEGVYKRSVIRPEGKFAVIDRGRTFTLAPWRSVMERARGQSISGIINARSISWTIGRGRGGR